MGPFFCDQDMGISRKATFGARDMSTIPVVPGNDPEPSRFVISCHSGKRPGIQLTDCFSTAKYRCSTKRGVAQPGSAPEWGSGGRRFKSSRPDQSIKSRHRQMPAFSVKGGGGDAETR